MPRERGVSDVIGFVLVAGLLLASVALVSITAFTQLNDAREAQQRENVIRAYGVLDSNIEDITSSDASRRTTEIKSGGGQVYLADTTTINVSDGGTVVRSITYSPIVYRGTGGDRVVYSSGAVIRDLGSGSTMVDEPQWYRASQNSRSTVYLQITKTIVGTGPAGVGGRGVISISATQTGTELNVSNADRIEISSTETPDAWESYCRSEDFLLFQSASSSSVTCSINHTSSASLKKVAVKKTTVKILLE